jgi:uncharacterized protein (TIGR03905 family)
MFNYKTKGVCSSKISFDIVDGKLRDVAFTGGCNGNLKAISKLVDGMDVEKVVELLRGNTCGFKSTSCADQLAIAIEDAVKSQSAAE